MKNLKKKSITFCLLAAFTFSMTSCEQELISHEETISSTFAEDEATISLYVAHTDEFFEVESIEDINFLLKTKYSYLDEAEEAIDKLTKFEQELDYSKSLDLDDTEVQQKYSEYLNETYMLSERSGNGILYDGLGSGFLSFTNVPWNLKNSKRNRASSWVGIVSGPVVLCDRTWWRGRKVVVLGIGQINLANLDFNNMTDSYF